MIANIQPTTRDVQVEMDRTAIMEIAERKGRIEPADIVEAARDPDHPLHGRFEWDDSKAAHSYRLIRAMLLIRRVKIEIVRVNPETKQVAVESVRVLQSPPIARDRKGQPKQGGSYIPAATIAKDPDLRASLIKSALSELNGLRKRYREVTELSAVWTAIDEATK